MEDNSGLPREEVLGKTLGDVFPDVNVSALRRKVRQVLHLGNVAFFDASLHSYVLPFRNEQQVGRRFDLMRQNCVVTPLREDDGRRVYACLTITDQTDWVTADAALKEASAEIEHRSRHDALTNLFHRGYVCERLEREILRVRRHPAPLSVLLLDIDWFKSVNDTWGHLAGDEILRSVSRTLRETCRETELTGRYGGEEFVAVMPGTDEAGAQVLGERIRTAIAGLAVPWEGNDLRVTASVGVAEYADGDDLNRLLAKADAALYDAKGAGRDRTRRASLLPSKE